MVLQNKNLAIALCQDKKILTGISQPKSYGRGKNKAKNSDGQFVQCPGLMDKYTENMCCVD